MKKDKDLNPEERGKKHRLKGNFRILRLTSYLDMYLQEEHVLQLYINHLKYNVASTNSVHLDYTE